MKQILIFCGFFLSSTMCSQSIDFSIGTDMLYPPSFTNGRYQGSETYSIRVEREFNSSRFGIGLNLRYSLYPGNYPWDLGSNPQLHNFDPKDQKIFNDIDYKRGFYNFGRNSQRWSEQNITIGFLPKYSIFKRKKIETSIFLGIYLDKSLSSNYYLIVDESDLKYPDGTTKEIDGQLFFNRGIYTMSVGGGTKVKYIFSENLSIFINGEFIYGLIGYALMFADLGFSYKL